MNITSTTNIHSNQQLKLNNNIQMRNYKKMTPSVNFCGAKDELMLELLDKSIDNLVNNQSGFADRLKFHKILKKSLPALLKPGNYLNCGRDSKVYRISDKYVAKVERGHYEKNSVNFYNRTILPNKRYSDLDCYYGEPVVKLGHIQILKNATPEKNNLFCGIPYQGSIKKIHIDKYEEEYLPLCSSLPQESFDKLANNLKKLNSMSKLTLRGKKYYVPDIINPNNVIISNNQFKIVDKLEKVSEKNPNSVYTMLEPLLLKLTPENPTGYNEKLVDIRKNILRKCLISTEKAYLPLDSKSKWEYSEWTLAEILPSISILDDLQELRQQQKPLKERLEFINYRLGD